MKLSAASILALLAAIAGCVSEGGAQTAFIDGPNAGETRVPVIAILDSGATPYLPLFDEPAPDYVESHVRAQYERVNITKHGTLSQDWATWESLVPFQLYHFEGTRMLAISVADDLEVPPMVDNTGHGTGTSFLAAREAPSAIVVVVQPNVAYCATEVECFASPSVAAGMEWIADQSWIDIVSVSLALPANFADPSQVHPEAERYLRASERAALSGKAIVNAAGNEIAPTLASYFSGPPWIIAVGGVQADRHGESLFSGKGVDVVANFTESVPTGDDGVMGWSAGTSLATPIVAGTLAAALAKVWAADPSAVVLPSAQRDALNGSAVSFSAREWDPSPTIRNGGLDTYATATLPVATSHQIGWGYVSGALADEIAHRMLDLTLPPANSDAASFQANWQSIREEYWSRV